MTNLNNSPQMVRYREDRLQMHGSPGTLHPVMFVRRLWDMVNDGVIVKWYRTGLVIVVNIRLYEKNVMRVYPVFSQTNEFRWLHRQLTCHGFTQLNHEHQLGVRVTARNRLATYCHDYFRRDKPYLLWKICCSGQINHVDRQTTQESCAIRQAKQKVGLVSLHNAVKPVRGEQEIGVESGKPPNGTICNNLRSDQMHYQARSVSQPPSRRQDAFPTLRPFVQCRTPSPKTRFASKRRRPATADVRQQHSRPIPHARIPEIIFVPHLVTANGLVPLEVCENDPFPTERRPKLKHRRQSVRQRAGGYDIRQPQHPGSTTTDVYRDITGSTARCDLTDDTMAAHKGPWSTANNHCSSGGISYRSFWTNDNGSPDTAIHDAPGSSTCHPLNPTPNIEVDESSGRNVDRFDGGDTDEYVCHEPPPKVAVSVSKSTSHPVATSASITVWPRPQPNMNPFVKLEKLQQA